MARTLLVQQVREHIWMAGEALRRHVTIEQVLAERNQAGISRREMWQGELGADNASQSVQGLVAASGSSEARIVIVGAGLAGLTCAYRLQQAGVQAVLYEAADRVGGRCYTCRNVFDEGQIAEHGGEFIDQGHKQVHQLVKELGLTLDNLLQADQNGAKPVYYIDGDHYTYEEATKDIQKFWPKLRQDLIEVGYPTLYHTYTQRAYEFDHMSVIDWINQKVPGGIDSKIGKLLQIAYNIEFGEEASEHSSLNLLHLLGFRGQGQVCMFGPSNKKYHVRGGNDLIVQGLVKRLSGQVEMGAELIAIKRNSDSTYTLTFSRGQSLEEVKAEKVVLTLPFSMLRKVDYSKAGFRPLKQVAIQEQGMGSNAKLQLQFHDRHWRTLGFNGDTYGDTGYQSTWEVTRAQPGRAGILNDFTGGKVGDSFGQGSLQEHAERFLRQIEPVFPGVSVKWNQKAVLDDWKSNRWSRGSFSYWKVGQYTKFAGVEGEPEGNCHFAGEHTSIEHPGYLNGAVETGERAAGEILADLQRHQ